MTEAVWGDKRMKGRRGLASMSKERVRQIASMGGRAAQAKGTAHRYTVEEARAAGKRRGKLAKERRIYETSLGSDLAGRQGSRGQ